VAEGMILLNPGNHKEELNKIRTLHEELSFLKENYLTEFSKCLSEFGLTDEPFLSLNIAMKCRGMPHQEIMTLIQPCIMLAFDFTKPVDKNSGDFLTPLSHRVELKGSSCYQLKTEFKVREVRPHHDLTHYLFHFVDGLREECYWFWIPAETLYEKATMYGYFNHATHGTADSNKDNKNQEHDITLKPFSKEGSKTQNFWKELLFFRVSVAHLYELTHESNMTFNPLSILGPQLPF
jgi:hypothetical protein